MIDKLDLRVPRKAQFTPAFQRLYSELQALDRGPFHAAKYYEYAGDLREYGFNVRLNLFCQMDKVGNHKIELIDVGTMSRRAILREIGAIFEVSPRSLGVMRVDFAVDVPDVPVQWFRETVKAEHKRFRAAVTGEAFYSEMGGAEIQTLYYGKRPNVYRIYDKQAEYQHQYRNLVRKLGKQVEPPSFESVFDVSNAATVLTRLERQIGGRVPAEINTLEQLIAPDFDYKPFAKLKILDHAPLPVPDASLSFETLSTGLYLQHLARDEGMQAASGYISKYSNGNGTWVRNKYEPFLASASASAGLTGCDLQRRFAQSLARQMAA